MSAPVPDVERPLRGEQTSLITKLTTVLRYAATFRNWPQVVALHLPFLRVSKANELRFRDGHVIHLLDATAEVRAYAPVYWRRCYDRDFGPIPRYGNVIDLGANVDIFTMYAATRLVPGGRVLAVEANPACTAKLPLTAKTCPNVVIWEGAVGGTGVLWLAPTSLGASIYRDSGSVREIVTSAIAPVNVLQHFPHVDLLKMNMEGAEYPFLLDTPGEHFLTVERIALKWHDGEIAHGHHPEQLAERLRNLGYWIKRHEILWTNGFLTTGITTASRIDRLPSEGSSLHKLNQQRPQLQRRLDQDRSEYHDSGLEWC